MQARWRRERRDILPVALATGFMTAIPVLNLGCCLWGFLAGMVAAERAAQGCSDYDDGDGALTGALTGVVTAPIGAVLSVALELGAMSLSSQFADRRQALVNAFGPWQRWIEDPLGPASLGLTVLLNLGLLVPVALLGGGLQGHQLARRRTKS